MRSAWWQVWLAVMLLLAGCAGAPDLQPPAHIGLSPTGAPDRTVYVLSNGFHTGLVLARADLPADRIPEVDDFPGARFLEFSWGDAEYFPADQATVILALRAALLPTDAVMHVVPLKTTPAQRYPAAELVRISLGEAGFARLVHFLDVSFERGGADRVRQATPGLYRDSWFYPATGRFHLGNTCNSWTARGLASAGVKVDPSSAASAEGLMEQIRASD